MPRKRQLSMALGREVDDYIYQTRAGCWLWFGLVSDEGYPKASVRGDDGLWRQRNLARATFTMHVRPLANDEHLDHLCHTHTPSCPGGRQCLHRRCVNPGHLEPVTFLENNRRARSRKAASNKRRGLARTHCKNGHELTPDNVAFQAAHPDRRRCRTCALARTEQWRERQRRAAS